MTRSLLLCLTFTLLVAGCAGQIVRDKTAYEMEVKLMSEFSGQQSELLTTWIGENCTCTEAPAFSTPLCQKSAETVVVAKARVPWHAKMMMINAGLSEEEPGETPTPPKPTSLCPASTATPPVPAKDPAPAEGQE